MGSESIYLRVELYQISIFVGMVELILAKENMKLAKTDGVKNDG